MNKKRKKDRKDTKDRKDKKPSDRSDAPRPADPVDVADGIPDRSANCPLWRYLVLGAVFVAWIIFMVYCQITAMPD